MTIAKEGEEVTMTFILEMKLWWEYIWDWATFIVACGVRQSAVQSSQVNPSPPMHKVLYGLQNFDSTICLFTQFTR